MRILGIDPGTSCGWAVLSKGEHVASGVWDLKPRRHEGGGMRYLRLDAYLREALSGVGAVYIEEVRRHAGTSAAHVYGGILATVQKRCEAQGIPYASIPVGTVKKAATGRGNASKALMIAAAQKEWPTVEIEDDNHADALWIALVGGQQWHAGSM